MVAWLYNHAASGRLKSMFLIICVASCDLDVHDSLLLFAACLLFSAQFIEILMLHNSCLLLFPVRARVATSS